MPISNGQFEEPDNTDRAEWAAKALETFSELTRPSDPAELTIGDEDDKEEFMTRLSDLLCNLRHLADQWGVEYAVASTNGYGNYLEERDEKLLAAKAS